MKKKLKFKSDYYLLNIVAKYHNINPKLILSHERKRETVDVRFILYKLMKEKGHTLKSIGNFIGGRDHSTIRHGILQVGYIKPIQNDYENILKLINNN